MNWNRLLCFVCLCVRGRERYTCIHWNCAAVKYQRETQIDQQTTPRMLLVAFFYNFTTQFIESILLSQHNSLRSIFIRTLDNKTRNNLFFSFTLPRVPFSLSLSLLFVVHLFRFFFRRPSQNKLEMTWSKLFHNIIQWVKSSQCINANLVFTNAQQHISSGLFNRISVKRTKANFRTFHFSSGFCILTRNESWLLTNENSNTTAQISNVRWQNSIICTFFNIQKVCRHGAHGKSSSFDQTMGHTMRCVLPSVYFIAACDRNCAPTCNAMTLFHSVCLPLPHTFSM